MDGHHDQRLAQHVEERRRRRRERHRRARHATRMVNPNIDAVGEVQVISNGFTAENGRSNGGLIIMTTKSGTNQFKGSAWYNARRDEWNANEYFRIKQNLAKPLYHVNIPGYSIGGPGDHPEGARPAASCSSSCRRSSPTTCGRRRHHASELPDGARAARATSRRPTSATRTGRARARCSTIINPDTGQPFPGNKIPLSCAGIAGCVNGRMHPMGQQMLNLLPLPNDIHNPSQQPVQRVQLGVRHAAAAQPHEQHAAPRRGAERPASAAASGSSKDREDNISNNGSRRASAGRTTRVPGRIITGSSTQVLELVDGQRNDGRVRARTATGSCPTTGEYTYDYRDWYRSALGVDPPRLEPFGAYRDPPGLGYDQADEYPYVPIMSLRWAAAAPACSAATTRRVAAWRGWMLPAANRNLRWSFQDDLSWTRGRHNFKFGFYAEWASKTEPQSTELHGELRLRAQRPEPAQHGQRLRERAPRRVHDLHRADQPRRPRPAALADGRVPAGQLAREPAAHARLRRAAHAQRRRTTTRASRRRASTNRAGIANQAPRLYRPICTTGVPGNQTCAANNQRAYDPANPSGAAAERVHRQPGARAPARRSTAWSPTAIPGMRPGEYFNFTAVRGGAAGRLRLGHQRRRQAGAAGVDRHLLRDPHARRVGGLRRRRRRRRSTAWSSGRRSTTSRTSRPRTSTFVETPINVAVRRRRNSGRSRSPTT